MLHFYIGLLCHCPIQAFVREYNATVPETWHVINSQDTVVKSGKTLLLRLYKRHGNRVFLSKITGSIIPSPSYLEFSLYYRYGRASLGDHYLDAHRDALRAVIVRQLDKSGLPRKLRLRLQYMLYILEVDTPLEFRAKGRAETLPAGTVGKFVQQGFDLDTAGVAMLRLQETALNPFFSLAEHGARGDFGLQELRRGLGGLSDWAGQGIRQIYGAGSGGGGGGSRPRGQEHARPHTYGFGRRRPAISTGGIEGACAASVPVGVGAPPADVGLDLEPSGAGLKLEADHPDRTPESVTRETGELPAPRPLPPPFGLGVVESPSQRANKLALPSVEQGERQQALLRGEEVPRLEGFPHPRPAVGAPPQPGTGPDAATTTASAVDPGPLPQPQPSPLKSRLKRLLEKVRGPKPWFADIWTSPRAAAHAHAQPSPAAAAAQGPGGSFPGEPSPSQELMEIRQPERGAPLLLRRPGEIPRLTALERKHHMRTMQADEAAYGQDRARSEAPRPRSPEGSELYPCEAAQERNVGLRSISSPAVEVSSPIASSHDTAVTAMQAPTGTKRTAVTTANVVAKPPAALETPHGTPLSQLQGQGGLAPTPTPLERDLQLQPAIATAMLRRGLSAPLLLCDLRPPPQSAAGSTTPDDADSDASGSAPRKESESASSSVFLAGPCEVMEAPSSSSASTRAVGIRSALPAPLPSVRPGPGSRTRPLEAIEEHEGEAQAPGAPDREPPPTSYSLLASMEEAEVEPDALDDAGAMHMAAAAFPELESEAVERLRRRDVDMGDNHRGRDDGSGPSRAEPFTLRDAIPLAPIRSVPVPGEIESEEEGDDRGGTQVEASAPGFHRLQTFDQGFIETDDEDPVPLDEALSPEYAGVDTSHFELETIRQGPKVPAGSLAGHLKQKLKGLARRLGAGHTSPSRSASPRDLEHLSLTPRRPGSGAHWPAVRPGLGVRGPSPTRARGDEVQREGSIPRGADREAHPELAPDDMV